MRAADRRDRHVHLTTEDDRNITPCSSARTASPSSTRREWNDDFHHAAHVIATGESDGYYARLHRRAGGQARARAGRRLHLPGRAVAVPRRHAARRAERRTAADGFIDFLQNHDQIGNRAFGERLDGARRAGGGRGADGGPAAQPRRFRCSSWARSGARRVPSCFFTDFHGELAAGARGPAQRVPPVAELRRPENRAPHPRPERV